MVLILRRKQDALAVVNWLAFYGPKGGLPPIVQKIGRCKWKVQDDFCAPAMEDHILGLLLPGEVISFTSSLETPGSPWRKWLADLEQEWVLVRKTAHRPPLARRAGRR